MYDTLWQTIQAGGYRLEDMLHRIDVFFADGKITDAQRIELIASARANADPDSEYPADWQTTLAALAERVTALEAWKADQETERGETGTAEEWPEYKQPTGSHDAYYKGSKMTYNGKHYICVAPDGVVCVWTPDVYPAYWEEA